MMGILSDRAAAAAAAYATLDGVSVNAALSNGNLTASHNSAADGGARTASVKSLGKWYAEVTLTNISGRLSGIGILRSGTALSDITTAGAQSTSVYFGNGGGVPFGEIFANSGDTGKSVGALANGDRIDIAVNVPGNVMWFRRNSGIWNASGAADPATNVGGVSIAGATNSGAAACGLAFGFNAGAATEVFTFNSGATPFAGALPSGFTGWTA